MRSQAPRFLIFRPFVAPVDQAEYVARQAGYKQTGKGEKEGNKCVTIYYNK